MNKNKIQIISTRRNIPFDFWKHPKISDLKINSLNNVIIHFDNLNNSFVQELYQNICINNSNGYLVHYRNNIYAITCYHGVKNCYKFKAIFQDKEYKLSKFIQVPEFDTAIFKVENINYDSDFISEFNIIDITSLNTIVPKLNSKIIVNSFKNNFVTKVVDYIEADSGSQFFTSIPQISINRNSKMKDIFGLSGSACYEENKFIGHIFSYNSDNDCINLIPAFCLKYIFTNNMLFEKNNLKCILIEGNICKIKEEDKTLCAYKIDKVSIVEYKTLTDKGFNFKKNSLVFEFDNLPINENGKIYFEQMGMFISPQCYSLLNNHKESFNVKGYELITGNYSLFENNIKPVNLLENLIFSHDGHNKILIYKNFVFTELSRDILDLIKVIDKNSRLKDKLENPYTKKNSKEIVLIDILENYSDENKKVDNLKKNFAKNNLIFLNKINKKTIDSLEDLSLEISIGETSYFSFEIKKMTYKNLIY